MSGYASSEFLDVVDVGFEEVLGRGGEEGEGGVEEGDEGEAYLLILHCDCHV